MSESRSNPSSANAAAGPVGIYFERQRFSLCAQHVLNMLFQSKIFDVQRLNDICHKLTPKKWFRRNPHKRPSFLGGGNYDANVVDMALLEMGYSTKWIKKDEDISKIPLETYLGVIVNEELALSRHWFCVKMIRGTFYSLDSLMDAPVAIKSRAEVNYYLNQLRSNGATLILVIQTDVLALMEAQSSTATSTAASTSSTSVTASSLTTSVTTPSTLTALPEAGFTANNTKLASSVVSDAVDPSASSTGSAEVIVGSVLPTLPFSDINNNYAKGRSTLSHSQSAHQCISAVPSAPSRNSCPSGQSVGVNTGMAGIPSGIPLDSNGTHMGGGGLSFSTSLSAVQAQAKADYHPIHATQTSTSAAYTYQSTLYPVSRSAPNRIPAPATMATSLAPGTFPTAIRTNATNVHSGNYVYF